MEKMSAQAHNLQLKLFIAVCVQTFVPLLFVYIPYFCVINCPFFDIPISFVDVAWQRMPACFPAWDAVIIICLIKDYRDGLVGIFQRKKKPTPKNLTWMTVSQVLMHSTTVSGVVAEVTIIK